METKSWLPGCATFGSICKSSAPSAAANKIIHVPCWSYWPTPGGAAAKLATMMLLPAFAAR
jgi:hypothetical protein